MSGRVRGKQVMLAVFLSALTECVLLLLMGWGGTAGWIGAEKLLLPLLLTAGISAAVGTLYLVRKNWSVFWAALLTGPGVQLLALFAGYLVFGSVDWGGSRWLLPGVGLVSAILISLCLGRPASGKQRRKRISGKKKRI